MCGLPGSGKTTIATQWFPLYHRVSQDELGSRMKCIKLALCLLRDGKDLIIDRVNHTKKQRAEWVDLANGSNVESILCVRVIADRAVCLARINARNDHPTITENISIERKKAILHTFIEEFQEPDILSEHFNHILITNNF